MTRADQQARAIAIVAAYQAGASGGDLAAHYGITRAAVSLILKRHGARLSRAQRTLRQREYHADSASFRAHSRAVIEAYS